MRAESQRIGLMVPSSNTSIEIEFSRALPDDISVHSARLPLFDSVQPEAVEVMSRDIENASRLLATAARDRGGRSFVRRRRVAGLGPHSAIAQLWASAELIVLEEASP